MRHPGSPRPQGERPRVRRRGRRLGAASRRSRTGVTGRAMILAVTLACVAAALAVPVKVFLDQRRAVSALQQQIGLQQQRIATLRAQEAAWSSPAYVEEQARSRLHYVLPGETDYIVIGGPPVAPAPAPPGVDNSAGSSGPEPAWYTQLWDSVRATAQTPAG